MLILVLALWLVSSTLGNIELHVIRNLDTLRQQVDSDKALHISNTHVLETRPSKRQKERDRDIL